MRAILFSVTLLILLGATGCSSFGEQPDRRSSYFSSDDGCPPDCGRTMR